MRKRGQPVRVRSKWSGNVGTAYVNDPHVWVEGVGVAGWYRLKDVQRDFLIYKLPKAERIAS